jgi:cobalamin biosynthesis protein CobD/CbiB
MDGDEVFWHGWFARHNNRIRHLGDMAADSLDDSLNMPAAALILLFLALMGALARETFRPAKTAVRQRIDRPESKKPSRKTRPKA